MPIDPTDPLLRDFARAMQAKAEQQGSIDDPEPVPETCTMDPMLLSIIRLTEKDPCAGCNADRLVCKGRPLNPARRGRF